jgi:hypothetical protein
MVIKVGSKLWPYAVVLIVWHYLFNGEVYITLAVVFYPIESAFHPIFFITNGTVEAGGGKFY